MSCPKTLPLPGGGCQKFFDHLPGIVAARIVFLQASFDIESVLLIKQNGSIIPSVDLKVVGVDSVSLKNAFGTAEQFRSKTLSPAFSPNVERNQRGALSPAIDFHKQERRDDTFFLQYKRLRPRTLHEKGKFDAVIRNFAFEAGFVDAEQRLKIGANGAPDERFH